MAGKIAVVTGGGGGIGSAVGELFCAEGACTLLVDRDERALGETVERIRKRVTNAQLEVFAADISDYGQTERVMRVAGERFGGLNVLVNNAAIRTNGTIETTERREWDALLTVNLLGAVNCCRAAVRDLRASGKASVVNVSSVYGVMARKNMGVYDATKAALISLTKTFACEEAEHGIRVNTICVAATLTADTARRRGAAISELINEKRNDNLLRRWAQPMEMAYPILWLASDESSFITGSTLMVDGGRSIV